MKVLIRNVFTDWSYMYLWFWAYLHDLLNKMKNHERVIFFRSPAVVFDVSSTFETSGWIKFNRFQKGFYRVNYPQNIWSRFSTDLQADNTVFRYLTKNQR